MTQLTDLMEKGYSVQISEMVQPDTVISWKGDIPAIVVHPLNYSYMAYEDPMQAHAINMRRIYSKINESYFEALARLDSMVDEMNREHSPTIVTFLPNVEVTENPDGSLSFFAQGAGIFDDEQDGHKAYDEMRSSYGEVR